MESPRSSAKAMLAKLNLGSFSGVPQPSEPPSKGSPGPSDHEKALIRRLEEQNFHNATTASSIEQQRLVNQKKEEIERNKANKPRIPKMNGAVNNEWEIWGNALKDWHEFSKKNSKKVLPMILKGIPNPLRPMAWISISGADLRLHQKYSELLSQETSSEKMIRGDISRTFPEEEMFQDASGTEMLFNVMKAYAVSDPEVGYCQGSAFIVGMLLLNMPEEDAFCLFVKLMSRATGYGLREMYKPGMGELPVLLYQLEMLIQEHCPELHTHFKAHEFSTSTFASKCLNKALLLTLKDQFLGRDLDGMMSLAQKEGPKFFARDPDLLINKAYGAGIKISTTKMSKWRKEFESARKKELAEEGEIRWLRAENRNLNNRILSLEKENNTLAHNLIQRSVKQAIEAEEKILLGKELKLAKRHAKRLSGGSRDEVLADDADRKDVKYTEEFVLELQQELVKARLREAEATEHLKESNERQKVLEAENRELRRDTQLADALAEARNSKKLESEAIMALRDLQKGLQANLSKDAVSSDSALEAMVSAAAGARVDLIETKQQINILEASMRRISQQRDELQQEIKALRETNLTLKKDRDRQKDQLLQEKSLRQCEESQAKIDQLEDSLNKSSFPVLDDEIPTTIPTLEESDKLIEKAELDHVERAEADDIDELTLKVDDS
ncbi:Oidioi.mRNA.OKI2018_I69.chr1.g3536.t1.cds [Oikopleura dioica]|uniref:Oidioi.mRNA.OKI2018_I69.chr1.g3536.t1.cds n=1 Tax=Oikopleura dioica TaxID=34765 RepID=A0ABN7T195_OIKDI|nr:Oidioi.mRNA.OKI2018_I69.chr1.g3536.t1.cds [Oikopleura dioica]